MEKEFNFLVYNYADENVSVNAVVKDESIWLTQKAMGELFGVDRTSIGRHISNIFNEGELDEKVVCAKIALTTQHGAMPDKTQTKETVFYNLDAIISVGYRVNSHRAIKRKNGVDNLEERPRRQGVEIRHHHCKELSVGKGNPPA